MSLRRRDLLLAGGAALGAMTAGCGERVDAPTVHDGSGLGALPVARIARPGSTAQVQALLQRSRGAVSIGGGCFSMGGQVAADDSLHLDMRGMHRLLRLDPAARTVRVQAGMRWRDLQALIDPHDLSVRVMQSYSSFTVGGSLSVNCHGRYVGAGPMGGTVRALQLVDAQGRTNELSPRSRPDLFGAVLGGYGGLGVVTEIELDLDRNTRIERGVERLTLRDYPAWFRERVLGDPAMVLHNADLVPPRFDAPLAISWRRSDAPPTQPRRLVPRDLDYGREQTLIWSASELPGGDAVRDQVVTERLLREPAVVWRNHEASLDVRSLEPRTRRWSTYLLQEYFVPVAAFAPFAAALRRLLADAPAQVLNVSIRHSPADASSVLRWAPDEVFSFVLYLKQRTRASADADTGRWTRRVVDAALDHGGRHYLPYRLHATPAQFRRGYPGCDAFLRLKAAADPDQRFRNRMWDKYLRG